MWQILLISLIILLCVDWYQTQVIAHNPDELYETNVILGKHPEPVEVSVYFAGVIALTVFLYNVLPSTWMHVGVVVGLGVELWCTLNNYRLGIR